jgi:hypothetical protein
MKLQPLTMEGKARIVRMHKAGCLGAQSGQKLGIACQSFSNGVKQFLLLRLLSLQSLHVDILSSTIATKQQLTHLLIVDQHAPLLVIQD